MLNTDDFVKRLELIFEYYGLSGASFADKIGIQRSSLSHLLSGRNKPSLEFVMKIVSVLPEVEFNWILNGIGFFPKSNVINNPIPPVLETTTPTLSFPDEEVTTTFEIPKTLVDSKIENVSSLEVKTIVSVDSNLKTISQIVIFYVDGTFSNYKSN